MKIKLTLISLLLSLLSACASTAPSQESLHLMDGSSLYIDSGKVVKMTDKTGAVVEIKKGKAWALEEGGYVYIRQDDTIKKIGESSSAHGHGSQKSSGGGGGGHSH